MQWSLSTKRSMGNSNKLFSRCHVPTSLEVNGVRHHPTLPIMGAAEMHRCWRVQQLLAWLASFASLVVWGPKAWVCLGLSYLLSQVGHGKCRKYADCCMCSFYLHDLFPFLLLPCHACIWHMHSGYEITEVHSTPTVCDACLL